MSHRRGSHHTPQLRVLSDFQIERLYQAALTCLERTGVSMRNAEARDLLVRAGAEADGVRVRIPRGLIGDVLETTPQSFKLWNRPTAGAGGHHERRALEVKATVLGESEPDHVHFGPGLSNSYFIDPEMGEHRRSRRGDPYATAVVCDALESIDYVMGLALIDDVAPDLAPLYEFVEMLRGTAKPTIAWVYSMQNLLDVYDMAVAVAGGAERLRERPFFALFTTSDPPLRHTNEQMATALWAAEHGIPVVYLGGANAGATAPVTGAGTLVVCLASSLGGLAAIQLKSPGAAVCVGSVPSAMDLLTVRPSYGGPETSLYSAAFCELTRYLGLPFMGTAGASESKVMDVQAAIASTTQVLLSGLSGAALVHDVGFLDCADIGSLEMLVVTDEIIAMSRRVLRGIEVSDETLMLDLIDEVGPEGHFIAAEETAARCRDEIWMPGLMNRSPWEIWAASGRETMLDRARKRVLALLRTHEPAALPAGAEDEIEAILEAAEEREQGTS